MSFKSTYHIFTLGLLIMILLTVDGRPRSRNRRQTSLGFQVIANSSFPCNTVSSTTTTTTTAEPTSRNEHAEMSSQVKPLPLSWEEIVKLMQYQHVSNDGTLTALTQEQTESFPNIIPLADAYKRIVKEQLNHDPNGILYKREIMQYLEMIENGTLPDTQKESHVMVRRDVSTDTHLPVTATDASTYEYCYDRGQPTADANYLYMCTVCSITTDLGEQYSPRYVNEAECHEIDDKCLVVDVESFHGKCQTIQLPLNILERQEGYCALALKDGETVIVEDWQLTTKMIKVGCECTVDQNSFFVYFL